MNGPQFQFCWKVSDHKHLYDDFNFYFITINHDENPKRIQNYQTSLNNVEQKIFNEFNEMQYHEQDIINFHNLVKSGMVRSLM